MTSQTFCDVLTVNFVVYITKLKICGFCQERERERERERGRGGERDLFFIKINRNVIMIQ